MSLFSLSNLQLFNEEFNKIPDEKLLITTLNAHCYNTARRDGIYAKALMNSDILLPDGYSIVMATKFLSGKKIRKIAGADLFYYELERLDRIKGTCFFLGSTEDTLHSIKNITKINYPNLNVVTYSPPYKDEFSMNDNLKMVKYINSAKPDVLFIGLTAPKQEKWAYEHFQELEVKHICSIGAVFDFFAGNIERAPAWMIDIGMEWLYRFIREPKRLWRRYLIGNFLFVIFILKEKYFKVAGN